MFISVAQDRIEQYRHCRCFNKNTRMSKVSPPYPGTGIRYVRFRSYWCKQLVHTYTIAINITSYCFADFIEWAGSRLCMKYFVNGRMVEWHPQMYRSPEIQPRRAQHEGPIILCDLR